MKKIFVIILNWNGWKKTTECINCVIKNDYKNLQLIIVDNNSTDGSILKIKEYIKSYPVKKCDEPYICNQINEPQIIEYNRYKEINNRHSIIVLKANQNNGYACGNNLGLQLADKIDSSSYKLILNNDTIINDRFISNSIKEISDNDQKIALLGFPSCEYINGKKVIVCIKEFLFKGPRKIAIKFNRDSNEDLIQCKTIYGNAMLILPGCPLKRIPEDYFLYYEESEFCNEIKRRGGKIYYSLKDIVYHQSAGTVKKGSPLQLYYFTRNDLYYLKKNRNIIIFTVAFFLKLGKLFLKISRLLFKGEYIQIKALIYGYIDFFKGKRGKQWDVSKNNSTKTFTLFKKG